MKMQSPDKKLLQRRKLMKDLLILMMSVLLVISCSDEPGSATDGGAASDEGASDVLGDGADKPQPDVNEDGVTPDDADVLDDVDGDVGPPPPPPEWVQAATGLPQDFVFKGVYVAGVGQITAVGNNGVIVQRDDMGDWVIAAEGDGDLLNAVSGSSADDIWAVGIDGLILHGDDAGFGAAKGCQKDDDCQDNDPCTVNTCSNSVCNVQATNLVGCCGTRVGEFTFDTGTLQGWTTSNMMGGLTWQAHSQITLGSARYVSPPYALYFGNPALSPPNFSNGQVVGASVTSPPVSLPDIGSATLGFHIYMDTEMGTSYDTLTLEVVHEDGVSEHWNKGFLTNVPTKEFIYVEVSLDTYRGENIQLRFNFNSVDSAANTGEGVYIDDVFIDTTCDSGSTVTFPTMWGTCAISPDRAYAVGLGGAILMWDGSSWKQISGNGATRTYYDVFGHGDTQVYVGEKGEIKVSTPTGQIPVTSPTTVSLRGVHSADGEIWFAVGDGGTILLGTESIWEQVPMVQSNDMQDVFAVSSNDVYAVGRGGTALHYDGVAWTQLTLPASVQFTDFFSVWVQGDGTVTITGDEGVLIQGTVATGFSNIGSLAQGGKLLGSWGSDLDSTLCLVGNTGLEGIAKALIYKTQWKDQGLPSTLHLQAVSGTSGLDIWAVGLGSVILHYDGLGWTQFDAPVPGDLYTVWSKSPTEAYAAGQDGLVLRWDGVQWLTAASQTTENLRDVFALSENDVYAVGHTGTIMHFDGFVWSIMATQGPGGDPVMDHLYGVHGVAADDIWAVGNGGQVVHYDGEIWKSEELEFGITLRDVYAMSPTSVWAVGSQGHILYYNGEEWFPWFSGSIATFYDLDADDEGNLYLVGDIGTVMKLVFPEP